MAAVTGKKKKLDFADKVLFKENSLQDNDDDDSDFDMGGFEEDESVKKRRKVKPLKLRPSKSQREIDELKNPSKSSSNVVEAPQEEDNFNDPDPLLKYRKTKTIDMSDKEMASNMAEEDAFSKSTKAVDMELQNKTEQPIGLKIRSTPVSSKEMWAHLISLAKDEDNTYDDIYDFRSLSLWTRLLYQICGPPTLPLPLKVELIRVFTLTMMELSLKDTIQDRMLQTIYLRLMGGQIAMPKSGSHWEDIGFQGNNPATDLRGSGLFGLAQLLSFTEDHKDLAVTIHKLSTDTNQNFPFALVSFNLTGLVLEALRQTKLYGQIKELGSVLKASNELHAAMLYEFYLIWKNEKCSIMDFDRILKKLEKEMTKNSETMIQHLNARGKVTTDGNFKPI